MSSLSEFASSAEVHTYSEVARQTLFWSFISSIGFLSAVIASYLILRFVIKTSGDRSPGEFGKFLILVELIDAIPEASLIAALTANGEMGWSFALSLMFLNIANTLASSMDFLATSDDPQIHRFVYYSLYFSVGTMTYSIPTQVFAFFKDKYIHAERDLAQGAVLLIATAVGAGLIALLMHFEKKILGHEKARLEQQHERLVELVEQLDQEQGQLQELRQSLRKSIRVSLKVSNKQESSDEDSEEVPASVMTRLSTKDVAGKATPHNMALELQNVQKKIQGHDQVLAISRMFMSLLEERNTAHVTSGFLQVIGMEHIIKASNSEFSLSVIQPPAAEVSLTTRALKLFGFMLGISTFAAIIAVLFSLLAVRLESSHDILSYFDSFFEGFSGGAFLATIAGTMLFRVHSAANGSALGTEQLKISGLILFISGLCFVFILDTMGASSSEDSSMSSSYL